VQILWLVPEVIMIDKEVGKLYRWAKEVLDRHPGMAPTQPITGYAETILDLIRKLVEDNICHLERLKFHGFYPADFDPRRAVLGQLDIPPEEF
jgi:hypothetical protein